MKRRCAWADSPPLMRTYHDTEWGTPLYDDRQLFEFLILEGMQAGLSWLTVLKKRDHYRKAFDGFDAKRIARYRQAKIQVLLHDEGIIRNRLKIEAAVTNARAFLHVQNAHGTFHDYLWGLIGGRTIHRARRRFTDIPANTVESDRMSHALKQRGFRFVGSTICYAFMQATGMVNDHVADCFRYRELLQAQRRGA